MKTDIDSLETKFFVISEDLNYKEVSNLDDATNVRPKPYLIVKKKVIGKTKSIYDKGHYAHSRYIFYNDSLKITTIKNSGWRLKSITEVKDRSRNVVYSISDPKGEIRRFSNEELDTDWSKFFQISGICNILKMIRELAYYPDWTYYELKRENNSLKKKVEELQSKL